MKKETALSGSVQEKNGKLYAVIGYGDPITKKRKYKWIGLNLTREASFVLMPRAFATSRSVMESG